MKSTSGGAYLGMQVGGREASTLGTSATVELKYGRSTTTLP